MRKRSLLIVKQLKQRNFEISLSESRLYKNCKCRRLSGRFYTLIWRPGETVQNLESPRLSRRVDSPASLLMRLEKKTDSKGHLYSISDIMILRCAKKQSAAYHACYKNSYPLSAFLHPEDLLLLLDSAS